MSRVRFESWLGYVHPGNSQKAVAAMWEWVQGLHKRLTNDANDALLALSTVSPVPEYPDASSLLNETRYQSPLEPPGWAVMELVAYAALVETLKLPNSKTADLAAAAILSVSQLEQDYHPYVLLPKLATSRLRKRAIRARGGCETLYEHTNLIENALKEVASATKVADRKTKHKSAGSVLRNLRLRIGAIEEARKLEALPPIEGTSGEVIVGAVRAVCETVQVLPMSDAANSTLARLVAGSAGQSVDHAAVRARSEGALPMPDQATCLISSFCPLLGDAGDWTAETRSRTTEVATATRQIAKETLLVRMRRKGSNS